MPDPLKTGFTSDQRIEQKFSFLMTDKASVESFAQAEQACTLKTAYTKNNPKTLNVQRQEKETSEELSFKDNESKQ